MNIQPGTVLMCINAIGTKHLTKGRIYVALTKTHERWARIVNDNGANTYYKIGHFKILLTP